MTNTAVAEQVTLTVNGQQQHIRAGTTLASLLAALDLDPRMIVVEYNGTIVRDRDDFATATLESGDTLELVHFVGGG
jgi:thiamine biosynthesis protein ThiS